MRRWILYIGIDLGGTNLHAGVVSEEGQLLTTNVATHLGADVLAELKAAVSELKQAFPDVKGLGLAVPGQIEPRTGELLLVTNLRSLEGLNLGRELASLTGLPVRVENDAVAAALAEGWVGQARAAATYLSLTLGTGVGSGVVVNGRVFKGGGSYGSEWGHLPLESEGFFRCGCGNAGCIETFCSATALLRLAQSRGLEVETARQVCDLAHASDSGALEVIAVFAGHLARALYAYTLILGPEMIVIGGGLAQAAELYLPQVRAALAASLANRAYMLPEIRVSDFASEAGIIGAACLCRANGRIRV